MSDEISKQLEELPSLPTDTLRFLWQQLFEKPSHPKLRRDLMIPILAYRIQEKAYGGLKPSTRKRLDKLAKDLERNPNAPVPPHRQIKTGTKFMREWRGETHNVLVLEDGFEYKAKKYESLSEVARDITGTRWSGPLFFGLKQTRKARAA